MTGAQARAEVTIRKARPEDAAACGRICYEAFHKINTDHSFPPDIDTPERGHRLITSLFSTPGFYCVVAEADGRVVGSNAMDERDTIAGIGPITVDPKTQNRGVGRKLMDAVLERAREKSFAGIRLVQAAFHNRSLSLYTTLGFDVREPLSVMQGPPIKKTYRGYAVRPARMSDVEACNEVAMRVHGHNRSGDLKAAIEEGRGLVVERGGRLTGYTNGLAFFGHAVAETTPDLQALIAAADEFTGSGILVPTRNSELFRWCLANGLRVVVPMTLMSIGLYNEPKGAFLPSVTY
jgi:predicted N-acetyltransferase YhbS